MHRLFVFRILAFAFGLLGCILPAQAQSPSAIPYQAVARNAAGNLLQNQSVRVRFSLRDGAPLGTVVYQETHSATTNNLGLFVVNIGQGTPVIGSFAAINWGSGAKFTQVELDPTGGASYTDMGTTQMLSVPYALYAATSGSAVSETDPQVSSVTTNQVPKWNGSALTDGSIYDNGTNIGIGTISPAQKLDIVGTVKTVGFQMPTGAGAGLVLQSDASGNASWVAPASLSVTETDPQVSTGSTNYIPKWSGTTLIDGQVFDDGSNVGIGTSTPDAKLTVVGKTKTSFFQMPVGAGAGLVLQSDANGNASWVAPTSLTVTGDNLGSHEASQNIELWDHLLTNGNNNYGFRLFDDGTATLSNSGTIAQFNLGSGTNAYAEFKLATQNRDWKLNVGADKFQLLDGNNGNSAPFVVEKQSANDRLHIQGNYVGIGTSSPAELLDVNGKIKTIGFQMPTGASNGYLLQSDATGNASWVAPSNVFTDTDDQALSLSGTTLSIDGGNSVNLSGLADNLGNHTAAQNLQTNGHWLSNDGNDEGVFIKSDGKVGIATDNPAALLDVNGLAKTANFQMTGGAANGYVLQSDANGNASWVSASSLSGVIRNLGNSRFIGYTSGQNGGGLTFGGGGQEDIVAIGDNAGYSAGNFGNLSHHIAIGKNTLYGLTGGEGNIAIGTNVLASAFGTYFNNTAIGYNALSLDGNPSNNTAIGAYALLNSWGQNNTGLGYEAGKTISGGANNTFLGSGADAGSASLTNATAIGYNAKVNTSNSLVLGNNANVGIGTSSPSSKLEVSGATKTTNFQMTNGAASGYLLQSDASGNASWVAPTTLTSTQIQDADADTKIEVEQSADEDQIHFTLGGTEYWKMKAGKMEVSNTGNSIYLGKNAGNGDNLSGTLKNVGIGTEALYSASTGTNNTAIGYNAGVLRNGSYNTLLGSSAGYGLSLNSNSDNTLIGAFAGYNCGANNTMIGSSAGQNNMGSGNVFIGNSAGFNANGSNKLFIANTSGTPLIYGDFSSGYVGLGTTSPLNKLDVEGSLAIGNTYSGATAAPANGAIIEGNVGIGTASPSQKLEVNGTIKTTNFQMTNGATSGYVLQSDASGNGTWVAPTAFSITETDPKVGSSTTGRVPRWTGSTLSDGVIFDDGTNVGIGTTSPTNKLDVEGGVAIGTSYAGSTAAPANGAIIEGKVGIGTNSPASSFQTHIYSSTLNRILRLESTSTDGTWLVLNNGSSNGNWTVYASGSGNAAGGGNLVFRENNSGNDMMLITNDGNVGIGTISPANKLDVEGGIAIGSSYSGSSTAPTNGAIIQGNVGIGSTSPVNKLDVEGSISIGSSYSGSSTAPTNGAIIEGNVGIGTTSITQAKLVINGGVSQNIGGFGYLNDNGNTGTSSGTHNYSVYATERIAASEFNAHSDARIKRVHGRSDNAADLRTLMQLKITDYTLIDTVSKGTKPYKKVIAQEVEQVYPQAVSTLTDVVPDIYQLSKMENGFVRLDNPKVKIGERVKLIFEEKQEIVEVMAVSEKGFQTKLTAENGQVFVFGREVSDFRNVDYEAISMLNVSATQALVKRLTELEKQNASLQQKLGEMDKLNTRMDALEAMLKTTPNR